MIDPPCARRIALALALSCTTLGLSLAPWARAHAQHTTRWDEARTPGLRRAEGLLFEAEISSLEARLLDARAAQLARLGANNAAARAREDAHERSERAQRLYTEVLERLPDSVSALSGLARLVDRAGETQRALVLLERARALPSNDPEQHASVLFQLGVEYTRLERFADARDAYEAYVALPLEDETRGVGLCNLAETYGYLRDLSRSIATYRACIDAMPDRATGFWGLSIACHRDGRDLESAAAARDALLIDRDLGDIASEHVFYVPPYEVHYYLAVAREAQGRDAEALTEWQAYLVAGGPNAPWADRARANRDRLVLRLRAAAPPPRRPPR